MLLERPKALVGRERKHPPDQALVVLVVRSELHLQVEAGGTDQALECREGRLLSSGLETRDLRLCLPGSPRQLSLGQPSTDAGLAEDRPGTHVVYDSEDRITLWRTRSVGRGTEQSEATRFRIAAS